MSYRGRFVLKFGRRHVGVVISQGARTSSVSVYGRNIKKCMGEY